MLTDTVRLIEQLRIEGRTVLLHCVAAASRTPTVAALYGARLRGIGIVVQALADVCGVLPNADPTRSSARRCEDCIRATLHILETVKALTDRWRDAG